MCTLYIKANRPDSVLYLGALKVYHFAKYPSFYSFFPHSKHVAWLIIVIITISTRFSYMSILYMCTSRSSSIASLTTRWEETLVKKRLSLNLLHFHFEMCTHYVTTFRLCGSLITSRNYEFYLCSPIYLYVCIYIYHVSFQKGKTNVKKRKWTFFKTSFLFFSVEKNASSKAIRKEGKVYLPSPKSVISTKSVFWSREFDIYSFSSSYFSLTLHIDFAKGVKKKLTAFDTTFIFEIMIHVSCC